MCIEGAGKMSLKMIKYQDSHVLSESVPGREDVKSKGSETRSQLGVLGNREKGQQKQYVRLGSQMWASTHYSALPREMGQNASRHSLPVS